jgi:hypothetical protein
MAIASLILDQLKKFKQYFDPLFGGLLSDYEEFQFEDCNFGQQGSKFAFWGRRVWLPFSRFW